MSKKETAFFPVRDNALQRLFADMGYQNTTNINDTSITCVVFAGGSDVTPFLYGVAPHPRSHFNPDRDMAEIRAYRRFMSPRYMKIGVCRGAQFLNVMNGGKLYQDVDNHGRTHPAVCLTNGKTFNVTSTHHQMIEPTVDAEIILVANEATVKHTFDHEGKPQTLQVSPADNAGVYPDYDDVEACFYEYTNSLCYQPHPEYMTQIECTDFFKLIINEYSIRRRDEYVGSRQIVVKPPVAKE